MRGFIRRRAIELTVLVVCFTVCKAWLASLNVSSLLRRTAFTSIHRSSADATWTERSEILTEQKESRVAMNRYSGSITDWVVENLESGNNTITSRSAVTAGENDTLPLDGLCIGKVRILAADSTFNMDDEYLPIRLLVGRNGWGTGVHPTTRLCLEWICHTVTSGATVLDYGCGSGILSIAALYMGAAKCVGVDVEAEALVAAVRNVEMNGYGEERFEPLHTREVLPYGISKTGVDVCVANILVGQLVRPSMVAAIVSNLAPGGLLCLSGIRPGDQVESLKRAYGSSMEWVEEQYGQLAASQTPGSIKSYGFDCGEWSRLVGRKKTTSNRDDDVASMSELAVS